MHPHGKMPSKANAQLADLNPATSLPETTSDNSGDKQNPEAPSVDTALPNLTTNTLTALENLLNYGAASKKSESLLDELRAQILRNEKSMESCNHEYKLARKKYDTTKLSLEQRRSFGYDEEHPRVVGRSCGRYCEA